MNPVATPSYTTSLNPTPAPRFHALVENADWAAVMTAVRQGVAWDDLRTRAGVSVLGCAVLDDASMLVGHLLAAGASPYPFTLFNGQPFSPLWAALERRYEAVARLLLDAGADADQPWQGRTPIVYAALEGMRIATRALCLAGVRPDPDDRMSPLHLWVPQMIEEHPRWGPQFGSPDPILTLLDAGANADVRDAAGRSVPDAARETWAAFLGGSTSSLSAEATLIALERSLLRRAVQGTTGAVRVIKRL